MIPHLPTEGRYGAPSLSLVYFNEMPGEVGNQRSAFLGIVIGMIAQGVSLALGFATLTISVVYFLYHPQHSADRVIAGASLVTWGGTLGVALWLSDFLFRGGRNYRIGLAIGAILVLVVVLIKFCLKP